jgi:hypothetical protein
VRVPANAPSHARSIVPYNETVVSPLATIGVREVTRSSPTSPFRRGAPEDLWRHTLSQISTVFGRLVYLSLLRNHNTGHYEHHGFAQTYGPEAADRAMRESHEAIFSEWIALDLASQKSDLDEYLGSLGEDPHKLVDVWLRLAPYRGYVPTAVRAADRALFHADLETLLETFRGGLGVSHPDRDV